MDYIGKIKDIMASNGSVDEEIDMFVLDSNDFDHVAEEVSNFIIELIAKKKKEK